MDNGFATFHVQNHNVVNIERNQYSVGGHIEGSCGTGSNPISIKEEENLFCHKLGDLLKP